MIRPMLHKGNKSKRRRNSPEAQARIDAILKKEKDMLDRKSIKARLTYESKFGD